MWININFQLVVQGKTVAHWLCCVFQGSVCEKLDESLARRQLKSPRSLSGRSIHLTLVTKWSWSWSWMTYCHPLCAMSIGPPILRYSYFKIWPWKSMVKVMCVVKGQGHIWPSKFEGQGYGQGQTHWSHLRPRGQSIYLLFVSWQSDHFWLRYSNIYLTLKIQGQGHGQGQTQWSHWALEFNRYVCFSFRGNRTIFSRDIANSIFDLERCRWRSRSRSNPMVTFEPKNSIDMFAFRFLAIGPFLAEI